MALFQVCCPPLRKRRVGYLRSLRRAPSPSSIFLRPGLGLRCSRLPRTWPYSGQRQARWFGRPFRFADLRRVAGFFAAAGLATAVSAVGGASTMTLVHTATAPYWEVSRAWFLS